MITSISKVYFISSLMELIIDKNLGGNFSDRAEKLGHDSLLLPFYGWIGVSQFGNIEGGSFVEAGRKNIQVLMGEMSLEKLKFVKFYGGKIGEDIGVSIAYNLRKIDSILNEGRELSLWEGSYEGDADKTLTGKAILTTALLEKNISKLYPWFGGEFPTWGN